MNKLSKGISFLLLLLISSVVWGQNKTITGRVTNEDNTGLAGASVVAKNTTSGTVTNENGEFTLSVPSTATALTISFIGYITREVSISGNSVSVSLVRDAAGNMNEVVVVGYGTQRKSVVTGAISSVR